MSSCGVVGYSLISSKPILRQHKQQPFQKRVLFYVALLGQLVLLFLYVQIYYFWDNKQIKQEKENNWGRTFLEYDKRNTLFENALDRSLLQIRESQIHDAYVDCGAQKAIFVNEDRMQAIGEFWAVTHFEVKYELPAQLPEDEPVDSREFPVRKLRMVDKVTNGSVPGVSDINVELNAYSKRLLKNFVADLDIAQKRQDRVLARDLAIQEVWDDGRDSLLITAQLALLNSLGKQTAESGVCMCSTVGDDLLGLRNLVLPWMMYHTEIGIQKFFIYYYGKDEDVVNILKKVQHLELIFAEGKHANQMERQLFDLWKDKHTEKFDGNFDGDNGRLVRQSLTVVVALNNAREQGKCKWMVHLDVDELLRPGHPNFSIDKVLQEVPDDVGIVTFMNFEGQPEAGDILNRFEQVTLFRAHALFVSPEAYNHRSKFRLGSNPAHLSFYADGRSAVRLDFPLYMPYGIHPHHFTLLPLPIQEGQEQSRRKPKKLISNETVILHYAYAQVGDIMEPSDAVRAPCYRGQSTNCYYSQFDVAAENVNSRDEAEQFFFNRMVLSEGSPIKCKRGSGEEGWCSVEDVEYLKQLATRSGLMHRFFEPQMILRGHQRIVKLLQQALGPDQSLVSQKRELNLDIVGPSTLGSDTYKDFMNLVNQENRLYQTKYQQQDKKRLTNNVTIPELNLLWGQQKQTIQGNDLSL